MPINKRNACHKYRVFAKHTSYLYNIYIKRGSNMIINWKFCFECTRVFAVSDLVLAHSERFPNVRVSRVQLIPIRF